MERFKEISRSKLFIYYACTDGYVLRVLKSNYDEQKLKVWKRRGAAYVKMNYDDKPLKQIIAAAFIKGYKKGDIVECIDGNPFNCCIDNLRVLTKQEQGRRTGGSSRNIPVRVIFPDGSHRDYKSCRAAARDLFCSYQTIIDKLNKKWTSSVIKYEIIKIPKEATFEN